MGTPKPFAKLFENPTLGQLLVQRSTNDDDRPGLRITFDPGIDELQPCDIFLSVGGVDDETAERAADELFTRFDEDMAIASVQKQVDQIKQMYSNRH
ncbi:hypothetical protein [Comamonas sp. lk]|uniref:hypothetical protein n=1 Tax=Comamonas sp. lk TaxID=2201272 RepID=UPI000EB41ABA|nr:hypothetical protein [Comamonas sp. lk]